MWSLYQQSLSWRQAPSSIIGLDPACQYLCWCFDEAILYFGRWVDAKLDMRWTKGPNKGNRMYSLMQVLDPEFKDRRESKSLLGLMAQAGHFAGAAHS